ncbi:acyloxyacyl hydrolase [Flavihumibacter petaseus]|uniref:Lipid A 3-O-deacylase n=1 Tax=Flavihumibacter petaseus NBRC 106054 TaxID=1220578 RepID=A0A0E9MXQ9_9BACT|nr:acyloxyacyl hydrolase [Flavihumibacter petaseus]GAO42502.1 hypothetical protein FPE01S_01_15160 [Flavihumibacter petaseus NBRC 106054]
MGKFLTRGTKLLVLLSGICLSAAAQDTFKVKDKFRFFSLKLHTGNHYYTGTELEDKLKNGYGSIELRYGWQSTGKAGWNAEHLYPSYGIGWYSGYIGDVDIFGSPHAFFGFITLPITHSRRNIFQVEPALGLTYNLKPYDPETNVTNDAIGAKFAVYFSIHAGGKYRLTREVDLLYGIDLTHFSNGRTVTPNLGLNMFGISVGGRYNFNASQRKVDNTEHPQTVLQARPVLDYSNTRPRPIRESSLSLYQAFGTVQNKIDAGTNHRYLTSSTTIEWQHKFNTKHGLSVGFDAFVDPSARDTSEYPENKEAMMVFFPGLHAGYDFLIDRLSIRLQVGYNLNSTARTIKGNSYVRAAVRYELTNRLFGQIGLKTMNGATADWIEWGLGYKVFRSVYRKSP